MSVDLDAISGTRSIRLVAMREVMTRLRSKSLRVATAVTVAVLVVAIGGGALATRGDDESRLRVGVLASVDGFDLGADPATGQGFVDTVVVDDDPEAALVEQDLDAVVSELDGGVLTVATEEGLDAVLVEVFDETLARSVLIEALDGVGVADAPAETVLEAVDDRRVEVERIEPIDEDANERLLLAYLSVMLLFFAVVFVGAYVAIGVVEEKANGIVETLLVVITPGQLLAGKVVGLGFIGFIQLVLYAAVGLGMGIATGLLDLPGVAIGLAVAVLGWYVLAYAFFAVLFAAAGSLVSRQEDVNAITAPINVIAMVAFLVSQLSLASPDSAIASTLAWVPPFSAFLVPIRIATSDAGAIEVLGSAAVMAAVTFAITVLGSRIYRESILRSGASWSWWRALRASVDRSA